MFKNTIENTLESEGRVPNYLKAVADASTPEGASGLGRLTQTVLFGGTLPPPLKLAMGTLITTKCKVPYAIEYTKRLAQAAGPEQDRERLALALRYADDLTRDVRGVSDESFEKTRTRFNDSQMVELTFVTCFFNYFSRLVAALGVSQDSWMATTRPQLPKPVENPLAVARIALVSDAEIAMGISMEERRRNNTSAGSSLGLGIANSQRAMMRVPDIQAAWMGRFSSGGLVPRTTLLQVSLAVASTNRCRYCVLHQVQGLRRQGVEIAKLNALLKDDSPLSPTEKAAVDFARKLTKTPHEITDADRTALATAFPGKAAYEVINMACVFAFMPRFTDGLRLPSEDESIRVYRETYGRDYGERKYQ
jgi:AhpD family alkylhydroperoxidase